MKSQQLQEIGDRAKEPAHYTTRRWSGGKADCVVYNGIAYVLKPSGSTYILSTPLKTQTFVCQGGCCDSGLQSDVQRVVETAAKYGAKKVVLRNPCQTTIAGLPTEDVCDHVGEFTRGYEVVKDGGVNTSRNKWRLFPLSFGISALLEFSKRYFVL